MNDFKVGLLLGLFIGVVCTIFCGIIVNESNQETFCNKKGGVYIHDKCLKMEKL